MTNSVCRFCKSGFPTNNVDQHVCNDCLIEVKKVVVEDEKLRYQLIEYLFKDNIVMERLAKEVFNVPVKNIGIGGPGTIAEFFRTEGDTNT